MSEDVTFPSSAKRSSPGTAPKCLSDLSGEDTLSCSVSPEGSSAAASVIWFGDLRVLGASEPSPVAAFRREPIAAQAAAPPRSSLAWVSLPIGPSRSSEERLGPFVRGTGPLMRGTRSGVYPVPCGLQRRERRGADGGQANTRNRPLQR